MEISATPDLPPNTINFATALCTAHGSSVEYICLHETCISEDKQLLCGFCQLCHHQDHNPIPQQSLSSVELANSVEILIASANRNKGLRESEIDEVFGTILNRIKDSFDTYMMEIKCNLAQEHPTKTLKKEIEGLDQERSQNTINVSDYLKKYAMLSKKLKDLDKDEIPGQIAKKHTEILLNDLIYQTKKYTETCQEVIECSLSDSPRKMSIEEAKACAKDLEQKEDFVMNQADLNVESKGDIHFFYTLVDPPIGKGAFGEVRKAIHKKTNITRAVKIVNKKFCGEEEQKKLLNEVNILIGLDHPNIMKILEYYQDDYRFYIVSEYYDGGELFDRIVAQKHFNEAMAVHTIRQILDVVNYCHKHNIVHRDLKLENVLYSSKNEDASLRVIDFGCSQLFKHNQVLKERSGSAYYIAPEVLSRNYTEKCDIWSIGVIAYLLLSGSPPFNGPCDAEIFKKIEEGNYNFSDPAWDEISPEAKQFICRLLERNVDLRYSAEQALNDPWIQKFASAEEVEETVALKTISRLSSFRAEKKFQEATLFYMAKYLTSMEEKAELLRIFNALDLNGDGQLCKEELVAGYKQVLSVSDAEATAEKIMQNLDCNHSGYIDYTEFVLATVNRERMFSEEKLKMAFTMIDKDNSGFIEIEDLKSIFSSNAQQSMDSRVWTDMMKECDQNADGKISFGEFKDMMQKMIKTK